MMGLLIYDDNDNILHLRHIVRITPCAGGEFCLVHMADGYQAQVAVAALKAAGFWPASLPS